MVLSEGKGVGAGRQSCMPSSGLAKANSILQPFPLLPLQTNSSIPLQEPGQSIYSLPEMGNHGPLLPLSLLAPGPWPQAPGPPAQHLAWPLSGD